MNPNNREGFSMIHHVFIIDARDEIVVFRKWEDFDVDEDIVRGFAKRIKETQFEFVDEIESVKYIGMPLGRGVVILCSEGFDDDETLMVRLRAVTEGFRHVISYEVDYDDFMVQLEDLIVIPLKVSILGFPEVGKTTFTTLLSGGVPPKKYQPTIAAKVVTLEGVRIGTYQVVAWDFGGHERFERLWALYFRGSQIVFVVTDSTLDNVLKSKAKLLDFIHEQGMPVKVLALANKQDVKGALSPYLVQRILGVTTYGMVAINPENREKALDIIRMVLGEAAEERTTKSQESILEGSNFGTDSVS